MIVLNIKCKNPEEMAKFRDRMCEALVGSPAFKNNENCSVRLYRP